MEKYVLQSTGEEVKIGSTIKVKITVETPFGETPVIQEVKVDEDTLKTLISMGIVIRKDAYLKPIFRKIARKLALSLPDAEDYVAILHDLSPYVALQLMLSMVSRKFNEGKDLGKFDVLYYVNINGEVITCVNAEDKSLPVFTSVEDAYDAINLLNDFYRSVYGEQKGN